MIIVEGMDGTGKTNLVRRLQETLSIPLGPKASSSIGGPVEDIFGWAVTDVWDWPNQPCMIYDRHPFVGEMIYGPIVRHHLDHRFFSITGERAMRAFRRDAIIIFCDVPLHEVIRNIQNDKDNQMPGVQENLEALWTSYKVFFSQMSRNEGVIKHWNYTSNSGGSDFLAVITECERHLAKWDAESEL